MHASQFNDVVTEQLTRSTEMLVQKASEYATQDRLHNFKISSALQGNSPQQALAGMMAKHSVSIYDMIRKGTYYDITVWNEKITDHINYLLLLKAIIVEEQGAK